MEKSALKRFLMIETRATHDLIIGIDLEITASNAVKNSKIDKLMKKLGIQLIAI